MAAAKYNRHRVSFSARCPRNWSRIKCNRCRHACRNCNKMAERERGFEDEFAGMVILDVGRVRDPELVASVEVSS